MKLQLLALLSVLAFASCTKEDDREEVGYLVNNVQDVTMNQGGMVSLGLSVKLIGNYQSPVSLDISDLPPGVTTSFYPSSTGTPDFSTSVTFNSTYATPAGDYPITLKSTSPELGNKTYNFTLHVMPGDCTGRVTGNYSAADNCYGNYSMKIVKTPGVLNRIQFQNLLGGFTVYANLDCLHNTFLIPAQDLSGMTISGGGDFTTSTVVINYTLSNATLTVPCSVVMMR